METSFNELPLEKKFELLASHVEYLNKQIKIKEQENNLLKEKLEVNKQLINQLQTSNLIKNKIKDYESLIQKINHFKKTIDIVENINKQEVKSLLINFRKDIGLKLGNLHLVYKQIKINQTHKNK